MPNEDSASDAFDFSTMRPGRIFTMAGERYRYLEDMDNGNHMIIRNAAITSVSWNNQDIRMNEWYDSLEPTVQAMVRPVADTFVTGL
ncbi:hypothetical protein GHK52_10490 [Lactococcus garvieae]|nr:hypothetical protein [Lactococcus garvieae]